VAYLALINTDRFTDCGRPISPRSSPSGKSTTTRAARGVLDVFVNTTPTGEG
jgi:hypothetical protein